ncbi:helix-turn-helix transcriptional regulator [Bradyrhizobium sp. NAS96.2]|uniref:helix-turn-helix domain-containing protein n=1 Tax=Bradyrhizobium sp. NAS96.2 TaxID=1680160 RepID=UPI0009400F69|nr:helix-turn-helix transcriptional regulator [Bradyrhizobium sp. NAS96.2]OKO72754.1 transcriptional regulator [Bradyrhizobium sp. NAS96.2]
MTAGKSDLGIIGVVADNVRALRKAAELSQEELAHEAGVDRTYISQVERRQRNVTIVVLAKIAKALNVTPDKLLLAPSSRRKAS